MLSLFKKTAKGSSARAGLALGDGSFALALVRRDDAGKPRIEHCENHTAVADVGPAVKELLDRLRTSRAPACAVVDGDDYQVVQIEAPEVLPSEMRAAVRWRLRDAIDFNVDEAAVDIFEMPDPVRRTQSKMLFAVAARDSAVQRIASVLKPVARGFHAIDIPELCLRNVSALLPQDAKGVAMLALGETFAQLVITRQGVMYLTRRIDTGRRFEALATGYIGSNNVDAGALALEIQRSLDYYESHYDQSAIGDLVIAPVNSRSARLAEALKNETSLRITQLDVRDLCNVYKSGELIVNWQCLMALGAALRVDSMEL